MTLTIELPDELADALRADAEARGEDMNHYAIAALADRTRSVIIPPGPAMPDDYEDDEDYEPTEADLERLRAVTAWIESHRGMNVPAIPMENLSRRKMHEDHL